MVPWPSLRPPFQIADAFCFIGTENRGARLRRAAMVFGTSKFFLDAIPRARLRRRARGGVSSLRALGRVGNDELVPDLELALIHLGIRGLELGHADLVMRRHARERI